MSHGNQCRDGNFGNLQIKGKTIINEDGSGKFKNLEVGCLTVNNCLKADPFVGVWDNTAFRTGSPNFRPFQLVVHADGTLTWTSQSVVVPSGYDDRNGYVGTWCYVGKNEDKKRVYNVKGREYLYKDGYGVGEFLAEFPRVVLTQDGPCEDDTFLSDIYVRISNYVFAANGMTSIEGPYTGNLMTGGDPTLEIVGKETVVEDLVGGLSGSQASGRRFSKLEFWADTAAANPDDIDCEPWCSERC